MLKICDVFNAGGANINTAVWEHRGQGSLQGTYDLPDYFRPQI